MMQTTEGRRVKWLGADGGWNVGRELMLDGDYIEKDIGTFGCDPESDDNILVKPWPDGLPLFVRYGDLIEQPLRND